MSFKDFVLDQLQGLEGLECRAMFGGHGLYAGPKFFGIVFRERFYLKLPKRLIAPGLKPFRPNKKQTLKSYFEIPADVLENRRELLEWARSCL